MRYAQYSLLCDVIATGTFKTDADLGTGENDLDPLDVETQRLVLEAGPGGWVALRRKQYGARSQLWRMTGDGQLQHEGIIVHNTRYDERLSQNGKIKRRTQLSLKSFCFFLLFFFTSSYMQLACVNGYNAIIMRCVQVPVHRETSIPKM